MTEPYRPSNSVDFECFTEEFCNRCTRDNWDEAPCEIMGNAFFFSIGEPEYPVEWQKSSKGPTCTAFERREDQ